MHMPFPLNWFRPIRKSINTHRLRMLYMTTTTTPIFMTITTIALNIGYSPNFLHKKQSVFAWLILKKNRLLSQTRGLKRSSRRHTATRFTNTR